MEIILTFWIPWKNLETHTLNHCSFVCFWVWWISDLIFAISFYFLLVYFAVLFLSFEMNTCFINFHPSILICAFKGINFPLSYEYLVYSYLFKYFLISIVTSFLRGLINIFLSFWTQGDLLFSWWFLTSLHCG